MMSSRALCLFAAAALAGAPACFTEPDVGEPLAGECDSDDSDPATKVSFGRDIRPLFDRSREEGAGCGCHNKPSNPAGGLGLGSIPDLMRGGTNSGADIVIPGDPCASILYQKMTETPPYGARMPSNGPPFFSDEETMLVHDWIAEGADDN